MNFEIKSIFYVVHLNVTDDLEIEARVYGVPKQEETVGLKTQMDLRFFSGKTKTSPQGGIESVYKNSGNLQKMISSFFLFIAFPLLLMSSVWPA